MGSQYRYESMNEIVQKDLEKVAGSNIPFEMLDHHTVLVTGASGFIGSEIVMALLCANRTRGLHITVIAIVRSMDKAKKIYENLLNHPYLILIEQDITLPFQIDQSIDYIIHGASVTSSKAFVESPIETISTAYLGTKHILGLANQKQIKGLVYLSSLEVYGITDFNKVSIKEEEYGYINNLDVRSSYSESKRMCECLCISYGKELGVPVKIARLTQTFGAGVKYNDTRVFAEFARCIIEKRDIVLHTKGETVRNYCYISDAVMGILTVLLFGNCQEAYNIANMETEISIIEMAQLLIDMYSELNLQVVVDTKEDIQSFGYNPVIKSRLDSGKLIKLGWKPDVNLNGAFLRMIDSMKLEKEKNIG